MKYPFGFLKHLCAVQQEPLKICFSYYFKLCVYAYARMSAGAMERGREGICRDRCLRTTQDRCWVLNLSLCKSSLHSPPLGHLQPNKELLGPVIYIMMSACPLRVRKGGNFFFETGFLCRFLVPVLELALLDLAGLELTEIRLPLPPDCWD